ncbi:GNAT family N-acetyltransferase [Ensifer adhaerens]|uniref:GNAT family N-acetyltransferase n=1 Tax=Ensifer adhaerens TaxID=106592 RepID=UPI00098EF2A9|nr:GNAT family N-acetyltransferase [Ensifer adhaerens]
MPLFSPEITDFWNASFSGDVLASADRFTVAVNPDLDEDSPAMVLHTAENGVIMVLSPPLAAALSSAAGQVLTEATLRQGLRDAGIVLNGADNLFYFAEADKTVLLREKSSDHVRALTAKDAAAFALFQGSASEEDLDAAYVELDHWLVYGAFDGDRLVCAASMYPWQERQIADLGVLTLVSDRGRGHARNVVRAISRVALEKGYQPQYRYQLDNHASVALAGAVGVTLFGQWEAPSEDG